MNTERLYPARVLAQAIGRNVTEIYRAHSEEMGSPRHFRLIGGDTVYTEAGVLALAAEFERAGWPGAGAALRRCTIEEQPEERAWYREGAMA
jgi:hypothetical protein